MSLPCFNLTELRPLLNAALVQAHERADREQIGMVIWLTHRPAIGSGDGVAVCAIGEQPPPESHEYQLIAPLPFLPPSEVSRG